MFLKDYLKSLVPIPIKIQIKERLDEWLTPNPIVVQNLKLWRHPVKNDSDRTKMFSGTYEAPTLNLLSSLLQPSMRFVDVGAHIGYFSLLAARAVGPSGKVWAFEASPATFSLLQRNIIENNLSEIIEAKHGAVTNSDGQALFYPHMFACRSGIVHRDGMSTENAVSVQTISLDAFFKERGWPKIDLVKMDIEGAESVAIQGMRELVSRNPLLKLIVEFNLTTLKAAKIDESDFLELLRDVGFIKISVIDNSLRSLNIPTDLPWLIEYTKASKDNVNLLCER